MQSWRGGLATQDPLPTAQPDTRTTSGVPRDLPGWEEVESERKVSATPGPAPGRGRALARNPGEEGEGIFKTRLSGILGPESHTGGVGCLSLGYAHLAAPPAYLCVLGGAPDTGKTPFSLAFSVANPTSREVFR